MSNIETTTLAESLTMRADEKYTPAFTSAGGASAGVSRAAYPRPVNPDNLETIRTEWSKTVADLEKQFDIHRKRLDSYCASLRATIDDMKRLGGSGSHPGISG